MNKTILVVEDDANYRVAVLLLVRKAGYTALEAANGREALTILAANKVDIVLSDVQMPVMGGMELLKHIQTMDEPRPKVIMMTGYSIHTLEDAIKAGAETLVDKTSMTNTLLKLLSSVRFY